MSSSIELNDDETPLNPPSPVQLVRDHPNGVCVLTKAILDAASLRKHPMRDELQQWLPSSMIPAGLLRHGALYLLHTKPDLIVVVRHQANPIVPSHAIAVYDIGDPYPVGVQHVLPLLDMEYFIDPQIDPRTSIITVEEGVYETALATNPNIPADRRHKTTRVFPATAAHGWGQGLRTLPPSSTYIGPTIAALNRPIERGSGNLPAVSGGGHQAHPFYHITAGQIAYRRSGPALTQQLTDMVAGVSGVSKDSLLKVGINEATVRALSAAPEAALCNSTLTGMSSYLSIANAWSLSNWDLKHFIVNQFNFPTPFNYLQLSPLTCVYETGGYALDSFQRSLRDLDESSKEQYATKFSTVAPALSTFRVDGLGLLLSNYLHLIFALVLMRTDLQDAFVQMAAEMVDLIRPRVVSPSDLSKLYLLQVFAIFRAAMRDFLLHAGSIREPDEMAARLNAFRSMILTDNGGSYLHVLYTFYRDCHMTNRHNLAYVASGLTIIPAPASAVTARNDVKHDDDSEQPKKKRQRGGRNATAKESSQTPSSSSSSSSGTKVATKAATVATAKPADATVDPLLCAGFNNDNGCHKPSCDLDHVCPPRLINKAVNPRWTRLHAHYARLQAAGTLRFSPNAAFLQGQPWPPASQGGAAAP